jgi:hypothetical protein
MALFTRKPEPLTPYADAPLYTAQGYAVLPVERYYAERGPSTPCDPHSWEQPHGGGGWAWGLPAPLDPENWVTGLQAGILPRTGGRDSGGLSSTEATATWLAVVRVTGAGKRGAKHVESIVGDAPIIRTDVVSGDLLMPYRAAVSDPREYGFRVGLVTCYGNEVFLASGPRFTWKDGRSPATVRRDELPSLNWTQARDLVDSIVSVLSKAAA